MGRREKPDSPDNQVYRWQPIRKMRSGRSIGLSGGRELKLGAGTLIMGILNATPDSFSDGGLYVEPRTAATRVREMMEQGADIVDIGGESTRPGAEPVRLAEELDRVIPIIREIRRQGITIPISVDTYKAEVARQALEAGADVVNDIWGLKKDADMAQVVAQAGCPVILMHNRVNAEYDVFLEDMLTDLRVSVAIAHAAGIADERIMVDPGIGFGKTRQQQLHVMNHLYRVVGLGYPVLLGTSRKSMIYRTLGLTANEIVEGTAATVALGIAQGCEIVRVHDVASMIKAVRIAETIVSAITAEEEE